MITARTTTTPAAIDGVGNGLDGLHRECFACGVGHSAGLNLHFEVGADGIARAEWEASAAFRSYPDRVHGGVIATLLDSAFVHALFARGVAGVTAEITIRYVQSVNCTDPVEVTGWIESDGHELYYCRGEVWQAGALAAKASAKFVRMSV